MKNVIMLHGTGETPESFWYPYIKHELEQKGYKVWLPQLPNSDIPKLEFQLPFILQGGEYSNETVMIAHSAGVPLALSVLESLDIKIKQAVLIAGFITPLAKGDSGPNLILQADYDWKKIRAHVADITLIHFDDNPWGCGDSEGRKIFNHVGGTLIIRHGEGHMGSQAFNQPYRGFPFLIKLID